MGLGMDELNWRYKEMRKILIENSIYAGFGTTPIAAQTPIYRT